MKLIYLYERRLPYVTDVVDFGYNEVRAYGWDIEVWCLLGLTYNVSIDDIPSGIRLDKGRYVRYINTFSEFEDALTLLNKEDIFFLCYPYHAYNKTSYHIRKLLSNYNFKFANITESPGFDNSLLRKLPFGFLQAIKHTFRRYILGTGYFFAIWVKSRLVDKKSKENFVNSWYRLIGPIKYPSYCNFLTTELEYYFMPQPFSKWFENNILLHSGSYTEYISVKGKSSNYVDNNYIVFIDQGLINRDAVFLAMGGEIPIKNSKKYVKDLCNLFSYLERDYRCKVVIAAHPKATYHRDTFENRKIVYGNTPNLIKNAKLVINQFSTAFFLVILFKKSFINIYTKELWQTPSGQYRRIYNGFKMINCKSLDISNEKDLENYKNYIYHYNEHEYKKFENVAIIDNKSCYREKKFYTYVCEVLEKGAGKN